ncbi:hypothetical protein ABZZ17_05355 [Streptomyces sp. NPDC006512]|uniref:hypothetical protein n=1 Tax=Streptomyces sp. NPDC006512 TaxID=3154307 RepID=UPI0033A7B8D8
MQRTKPSRFRVLVPSALALVILSGAAAPAVAADGEGAAGLTKKVEAVQEQIESLESRAAAGPIDDLLAGIGTTLADLLKSLQALLPGVTLPPIELPKLPALPEIPAIPGLPAIPQLPQLPQLPVTTPAVPPTDGLVPAIPEIPAIPDIPIH